MNKKVITALGKLITLIAVAVAAVIISSGIHVHADNGETVRVKTAKELKAAIKDANVGTIILRTEAFLDITIKSAKSTKSKSLIIDAKNANITNKSVFADINIISANSYTESVSGNRISLSDCFIPDGLTVSKKKKVESLTVYSRYGIFENNYTLRKGAKIGELSLVFAEGEYPVVSKYNKSKRVLTIECEEGGCERAYTIKLDKSGRMISLDCKSNWPESDYDEAYTYDSNGNVVKITGNANMSGNYTTEITYSGNLGVKSVYEADFDSGLYEYTYDKNGRLVHMDYAGEDSIDGITTKYATSNDYEYDEKGRIIYERSEDVLRDNFYETSYTYNSKGFLTEMYVNNGGSEAVNKYKYDKAGNLVKVTYTSDGYTTAYTYEYDEFGVLVNMTYQD